MLEPSLGYQPPSPLFAKGLVPAISDLCNVQRSEIALVGRSPTFAFFRLSLEFEWVWRTAEVTWG